MSARAATGGAAVAGAILFGLALLGVSSLLLLFSLGRSAASVLSGQRSFAPQGSIHSPSAFARADIPPLYLELYIEAAARFGLDWTILAGIGRVECDHGRDPAPSCTVEGQLNYAGAGGPAQFLVSTWKRPRLLSWYLSSATMYLGIPLVVAIGVIVVILRRCGIVVLAGAMTLISLILSSARRSISADMTPISPCPSSSWLICPLPKDSSPPDSPSTRSFLEQRLSPSASMCSIVGWLVPAI